MNIIIAGGSGLIGRALCDSLLSEGHFIWILSRKIPQDEVKKKGLTLLKWDGSTPAGWGGLVSKMDAVINLAGESLSSWPWTKAQKERFLTSRVNPGKALTEAIRKASPRPKVLIQASGINHYGLDGVLADESTPPGEDFLARLTVEWEGATKEVESLGVRRCVTRQAIVLAPKGGLLPLMTLPVRLLIGGPLGTGKQAVPWIHIDDVVGAMRFLLFNEDTSGPYNLISPESVSNSQFYKILCKCLHLPYWFKTPAFLLRIMLGEMSVLILKGRYSTPSRLILEGYSFKVGELEKALCISIK